MRAESTCGWRTMAVWLSVELLACGTTPPGTAARSGQVRSAQMVLNGVSQGMSEQEVRGLLGPPHSTTIPFFAFLAEDSLANWEYPGLRIEFIDHEVNRLVCSGTYCTTADGIKVGDSESRVLAIYDSAQRSSRPLDDILLYRNDAVPCTLAFRLRHRVVRSIEIECEGS